MKKKLIQLRGACASGKSTAASAFLQTGNFESREIRVGANNFPYSYDEQQKIVVTGRYNQTRACGGLDGVKVNREDMLNYLTKIIKGISPDAIIFEAVMYGKTSQFARELQRLCWAFGYEYVGLSFLPPFEAEMKMLAGRNGKAENEINTETIYSQYKSVYASHKKLKAEGFNMKIINTAEIPKEKMGEIIIKELK